MGGYFGQMSSATGSKGLLGRLRRDVRGNTLAMMAISLIPISALAGSAVDMSRLYVVKVRLQQACDAGVLAGRKFMDDSNTTSTLDATATTRANQFFANNFRTGWMGTSGTVFTPSKSSDSQVSGTASTVVPMTVMKMFGFTSNTLSVTCRARYDVADTDVIFVLDTTGSMACLPSDSDSTCTAYVNAAGNNTYTRPSGSGVQGYSGTTAFSVPEKDGSRIDALRTAVLSFYDTFAANADPSTHVRYGFVTYTSSVNVGKAIQEVAPSVLVGSASGDTATYQSRQVYSDYESNVAYAANGKSYGSCNAGPVRTPSVAKTYDTSNGTAKETSDLWYNGTCYTKTRTLIPKWVYKPLAFDVTGVVAGNTVTNPTKVRGQTMRWYGCVETNVDTKGQTTFSATNPPSDIDPDASPSGSQRWIPQMQDLAYRRNGSPWTNTADDYSNGDDWDYTPGFGSEPYVSNGDKLQKGGFVACGKPVKRLGNMSRSQVSSFVNAADFVPLGGTYHDTGMIWGARLISPTGLWANDTTAWANRNAPNRVIVFMTDGQMAPSLSSYSMYGMEGYDRRATNGDFGNITDYHNRRFLAACAAAKARNIDIWTIAIDDAASPTLQSCATTTTQSFFTTSGDGLEQAFRTIAQRLAMLRITQ